MLGKGLKRKRSQEEEEEEAGSASAPPSSALFSISVSKLHRSLQRGEPDLRHLVLVANTLRRIRDAMEPPSASGPAQPLPPPCLAAADPLPLSDMDVDASLFSSILEELTSTPLCPALARPQDRLLCPEPARTAQQGLLEPPGEDLDGLFEDIDTSMYDCDPWAPGKEACAGTQADRPDLADLDYLLDVLVGL